MAAAARAKISVSVDAALVDRLDREVASGRQPSRSAAIEAALAGWARMRRKHERDAAIEAYYLGQSREERAEDREWAAASSESLAVISRRERAQPSRRRRRP